MFKGKIQINKGLIWRYVSEGLRKDYMASEIELREFDDFLRFQIQDFNITLGGDSDVILSKDF